MLNVAVEEHENPQFLILHPNLYPAVTNLFHIYIYIAVLLFHIVYTTYNLLVYTTSSEGDICPF